MEVFSGLIIVAVSIGSFKKVRPFADFESVLIEINYLFGNIVKCY